MTTLSDLITRLEAAKEGSRELDLEIAKYIDWHHPKGNVSIVAFAVEHPKADVLHWDFPSWTRSFDAAHALLDHRWYVRDICEQETGQQWDVHCFVRGVFQDKMTTLLAEFGRGKILPTAMVSAALKANAAMKAREARR